MLAIKLSNYRYEVRNEEIYVFMRMRGGLECGKTKCFTLKISVHLMNG